MDATRMEAPHNADVVSLEARYNDEMEFPSYFIIMRKTIERRILSLTCDTCDTCERKMRITLEMTRYARHYHDKGISSRFLIISQPLPTPPTLTPT